MVYRKYKQHLIVALLFMNIFSTACSANPEKLVQGKKGLFAVIETDKGNLILELYPDAAPKTVENFVQLSGKDFYKDIIFHRVIKNFMAQTGDPTGKGSGGPGYTFNDEINADALGLNELKLKDAPQYGELARNFVSSLVIQKLGIKSEEEWNSRMEEVKKEFQRIMTGMLDQPVKLVLEGTGYIYTPGLPSRKAVKGSLAMANSGPNTNGSQFFINQVDTPHLNGLHTVFGQLTEGYDVLDKIIDAGDKNSKIKKITIVDHRK
jgi:cyclophilin family peptidyl-prolyl cis-trans isomerase